MYVVVYMDPTSLINCIQYERYGVDENMFETAFEDVNYSSNPLSQIVVQIQSVVDDYQSNL